MGVFYSLYGLKIQTELDLPCYATEVFRPDVTIERADALVSQKTTESNLYRFQVGTVKAFFEHCNIAIYWIEKGSTIVFAPFGSPDPRLIINTLLGTPFGILLLQRGYSVFHGNAVNVNGKSVCFLGRSGAGKSTTAVSLIAAGHKLISDDVVATNPASDFPLNPFAGYPWMKVSREAIAALKLPSIQISELHTGSPKLRYDVGEDTFCQSPGEFQAIYIPVWADDYAIEPVKMNEAILYLVAHGYGYVPRVNYPVEERKRFLEYSSFVQKIPCFLLKRPRNINQLPRVADMVVAHVQEL